MKKRFSRITLVLLVLMLSIPLFAEGKVALWQWNLDDPEVTGFRYQLNGEDPENWTYVAADVDTFKFAITDPTQDMVLYLQSTYDGEIWSDAAVAVIPALQPAAAEAEAASEVAEEAPAVADEPVTEPEAPAETEAPSAFTEPFAPMAPAAPVEPAAPVTEPEPFTPVMPVTTVSSASRFDFSLLIKGGIGNRISFTEKPFFANGLSNARADIGIALDFENIISIGNHFGFGLRSDIFVQVLPGQDKKWSTVTTGNFFDNIDFDASADLKIMLQLEGGPVAGYLGAGFGYSLYNQANTDEANTTHTALGQIHPFNIYFNQGLYVPVVIGARCYIGNVFSIGIEGYGRWMLRSNKVVASADLVFGFTF